MDMNEKVKITNNTTGEVGYSIENRNVRRNWLPGQTLPVTLEEIQEGLFNPGIDILFRDGLLLIDTVEHRVALGLASADVDEEKGTMSNIIDIEGVYSKDEIIKALKSDKMIDIASILVKATPAIKELVVELAIDNEITDFQKTQLIEKHTGNNIITIIQNRKKLEDK